MIPSSPAVSAQTSSKSLPTPNIPSKIPEPFELPHLIIPIDKSSPNKIIGNGFRAQLSPTISTVFVYDVSPAYAGKTCTLVFYLPPPFKYQDLAPVQIRASGGISVARLSNPVSANSNANNIGNSSPVGSVSSVQLGNQYTIASALCQAGQTLAYEVDSLSGLTMDWFQMTYPPLGLFTLVSEAKVAVVGEI